MAQIKLDRIHDILVKTNEAEAAAEIIFQDLTGSRLSIKLAIADAAFLCEKLSLAFQVGTSSHARERTLRTEYERYRDIARNVKWLGDLFSFEEWKALATLSESIKTGGKCYERSKEN
ncbi:MAG: hypothetical protein N2376_00800 [Clostridia bacterium]|nr:hypothetical protein [Clostridia bacterium]